LSDLISGAETSMRGFVITRDSSYLLPADSVKKQFNQITGELSLLVADNKRQENRLAMIRSTLQLRLQLLESLQASVENDSSQQVILQRVAKGRDLMTSFHENLDLMEADETALLKQRFEQKERFQRLTSRTFRTAVAIVGFIFLGFFILLIKAMLDRFRFQQELQEQLLSLKQSNDELTQLAFAASHDLQEPVRKIRTFADRLRIRQKDKMDEEGKMILDRIDASGKKLQGMLEDISTYMNLLEWKEEAVLVSIRKLWEEVVAEEESRVQEMQAIISLGELPDLKVYPGQVKKMFRALLDNALSYYKEGRPPVISISHRIVDVKDIPIRRLPTLQKHYHEITIQDNGIGFENEFKEKVFQLFRRLHTQEDRSGKGIGLAICQRVMANHNGVIDAHAVVNKGAAFIMYFPQD
jgi:signal transduction histidine kinase